MHMIKGTVNFLPPAFPIGQLRDELEGEVIRLD
jgi:hypothetical protein